MHHQQQFGPKDGSVIAPLDNTSVTYHSQFSYGANDNWTYGHTGVTPMKQIEGSFFFRNSANLELIGNGRRRRRPGALNPVDASFARNVNQAVSLVKHICLFVAVTLIYTMRETNLWVIKMTRMNGNTLKSDLKEN